jgi:hypothetical protein
MPKMAEKHNVKIVAGPFVNREHLTVVVAEAAKAEDLDAFILESRLAQWNSVRILPSLPLAEALNEVQELSPLF